MILSKNFNLIREKYCKIWFILTSYETLANEKYFSKAYKMLIQNILYKYTLEKNEFFMWKWWSILKFNQFLHKF